jgi:sulfur carrier protein
MYVNGARVDQAGSNLADYLARNGYRSDRVAVERNGDIVPRARYAETLLRDDDRIEIVTFMGGG